MLIPHVNLNTGMVKCSMGMISSGKFPWLVDVG